MRLEELRQMFNKAEAAKVETETPPTTSTLAEIAPAVEEPKAEPTKLTREEVRKARLECTSEGHDKEYNLTVYEESSGAYSLMASWGKRGKTLQSQEKARGPLSRVTSEYTKLIVEKKRKGYQLTNQWER